MKNTIISLMVLVLFTNCAIFSKTSTIDQKAAEIRNLSYAAASIGTQVALKQNPNWKTQFDIAYTSLDTLVNSKRITGSLLRDIIAGLPVKELKGDTAKIAIEGATTLFDATIGDKINIENDPYVLAAATGIRDGMKIALGY
jgi:hypothetical protein